MCDLESMKKQLKKADMTKLFFTDLNGRLKNLSINPDDIENLIENGVGIDGSSIAGIATVDNSDRVLKPVAESFRLVDFGDKKIGFMVGQLFDQDGIRTSVDPRFALEKAVAKAETDHKIKFMMGPEYEFFLLNDEEMHSAAHTDNIDYFTSSPLAIGDEIRQEIVEVLASCGIKYEKHHHEVTPSQHEVNLEPGDPLSIADRTILFIFVAKEIAAKYDQHVTFMPKPFSGYNRNAFHIHMSFTDMDGNNLCYDENAEHKLSPMLMNFVGGVIKHAREASIIFASTINSYKAYVLGKEAPVVRGWGLRNRSSMVRIPHILSPKASRFELRCPDPSGNVYLQFATLIQLGLDGLENKLDPGSPDMGSTYKKDLKQKVLDERFLPRDFYEALLEAENGCYLKEVLGEDLFNNYLGLKFKDWEEYRTTVTDYEHNKYLTI